MGFTSTPTTEVFGDTDGSPPRFMSFGFYRSASETGSRGIIKYIVVSEKYIVFVHKKKTTKI